MGRNLRVWSLKFAFAVGLAAAALASAVKADTYRNCTASQEMGEGRASVTLQYAPDGALESSKARWTVGGPRDIEVTLYFDLTNGRPGGIQAVDARAAPRLTERPRVQASHAQLVFRFDNRYETKSAVERLTAITGPPPMWTFTPYRFVSNFEDFRRAKAVTVSLVDSAGTKLAERVVTFESIDRDSAISAAYRQALALRREDCPPPPGGPGTLTPSPWLRRPSNGAVVAAFPAEARRAGIEAGEVELGCVVDRAGGLENCAVRRESPADMGFGAAALSLTNRYQVKETGPDGQSVFGKSLIFGMLLYDGD